jgi:DNA-binding response OmpR family regulator
MSQARRILVVDDQQDIRLMCRVNLALEGYQVLEADEGARALDLVRDSHPDLVLLDVMMPGVDGWRVLETMKADPDLAGIPVVMLTARVQREDELRGWSGGASEYLAKPFNPSTLTEVVHRLLSSGDSDDRRARAIRKLQII